jgi:hypothetical protein
MCDRVSQLALVSIKITERVGLGESLATCIERGFIDELQLIEEIDLIVDSLFGSRSLDKVQSAVKRFLENYSLGDRATRLEQILREAEPLLPLNTSDPYFYNDTGKSANIIGFKDTDNREVTQFKKILFNDLGIPDSHLKPIQAEDEIVFVSEYAAFPLRLIQGLPQMRQHYLRQKSYGNGFLHNDYRTMFTDIIPPDAREMKQLQDIFYPSLAFKLLPYNSQTGMHEFQYYDRLRDTHEVTSISSVWNEALEQLANLKDMAEALNQELNKATDDITHNPKHWESKYLPMLREFVAQVDSLPEDHPNYLYKKIVVGTRASVDTKAQEGIINRFWRRMQEISQKRHQQIQAFPTSENQPVLSPETSLQNSNQTVIEADDIAKENTLKNDSQKPNTDVIDVFSENDLSSKDQAEITIQLEKLRKLREAGLITEGNFKAKEKEILDLFL